MKRANQTEHFLMVLTLLTCLLTHLTGTTAKAEDEGSAEVSAQTGPISIDGGRGADDRQVKDLAATPPVDMMVPPMMPSGQTAPAFGPEHYDWIRLTSGEWLKGDITSLRDDKLEFDSDEMDDQTFDWEDVAEVRSSRIYTYVFTDRTGSIGTALILGDKVVISSDGEDLVGVNGHLVTFKVFLNQILFHGHVQLRRTRRAQFSSCFSFEVKTQ